MSSRCLLIASCLVIAVTSRSAWAEPPAPKEGPLGIKFVPLPKGTFYMGWDSHGNKGKKTEIKEDFEIAIHTVTQGQWQELMGSNPSWFSREGKGKEKVKDIKDEELKQFPVERVSWDDAQEFIKKLNEKEKGKGYLYRLPSAAEWEYACRGGATSEEECSYSFYFEKPTNDLSYKQANFNGNYAYNPGLFDAPLVPYLGRPSKVGSYKPNKLGLYDMHGNVWQWHAGFYDKKRTLRGRQGGAWYSWAHDCQAASGLWFQPAFRLDGTGFRLVRDPVR
jgi:formylglycine-generating enzyme required for sulfatase activity